MRATQDTAIARLALHLGNVQLVHFLSCVHIELVHGSLSRRTESEQAGQTQPARINPVTAAKGAIVFAIELPPCLCLSIT